MTARDDGMTVEYRTVYSYAAAEALILLGWELRSTSGGDVEREEWTLAYKHKPTPSLEDKALAASTTHVAELPIPASSGVDREAVCQHQWRLFDGETSICRKCYSHKKHSWAQSSLASGSVGDGE